MKTWKEMTKLETKTKVRIIIHILIAILSLVTAATEKNGAWAICGMLWIVIAVTEYCDTKLLKSSEALNDIKEKNIEVQADIINTLLNKTAIEIDMQDIKIPKYFTKPNPKKLKERFDYYKQHKRFKVPIIIDNDYTLIDGYTSYLIAKNHNKVSVIAHLKRNKGDIYGR